MEGEFPANPAGRVPLILDLDPSIFTRFSGALTRAAIDAAPVLTGPPSRVDQTWQGAPSGTYYVPAASIPRRTPSSATPAVFIGKSGDAWQLRVTLELRRHPSVAADASPLPLDGVKVAFVTSVPGVSVVFTEVHEEPTGDPGVARRLVAVAPLDDPARVAAVLQKDETAVLTVTGTVHWRLALPPEPEDEGGDHGPRIPEKYIPVDRHPRRPGPLEVGRDGHGPLIPEKYIPVEKIPLRPDPIEYTPHADLPVRELFERPRIRLTLTSATLAAESLNLSPDALRLDRLLLRNPGRWILERPDPPPRSEPHEDALTLTADRRGISMWFPTEAHANRPIYALVNGAIGFDPDTVWITGPAGPWKASPIPNQYYVLPTEYRLAFDTARGVPAVTALLREQPVPQGRPASAAHRVRVRFALTPWFAPEPLERLRTTIAEAENLPYPEFAVGGLEKTEFRPSSLFTGLGGDVVEQPDGSAVDPRGFELVYDCSLEFYTLLCRMLAPAQGPATGIEASVRVTLKTSPEDAGTVREIPVRIRLDAPNDEFLEVEPDGAGRLTARVRNLAAGSATVRQAVATLLVVAPAGHQPVDAVPADVSPLPFTVAAGGETTVTLVPREPVDPGVVGRVALDFDRVGLDVTAADVLERVHELAATVNLDTTVRVRSFQLQHAADLPPELAGLEGLEVQLRRGGTDPVTVYLTREEWDKTVHLAYTLADLVAGMSPDAPRFEWRRRNLTRTGTGPFSAWEQMAGGDLYATPIA
ncbi:hypothetical protein DQ384_19745 [Sphaerisporangium album]|uniref:Uncharacterized protein n=1 Tax=Sphaerisporangium album TaxID=509200 RepID=A0A367FHK1_9ACTN|nr:hypothetical protein [Sphaerisporangium album]RCG29801.1 hypothetical protein DQ384_19745 [Sphaerisporangium album]